ncbi:MAG TPA: hypothetical protein PKD37_01490 [Oligoflexia bacterium]|nr:hypothetical protein [Oligoflexia bacterium]HMP26649.1 hypothetical protein [Oligoflexia bacterium]
MNKDNLAPKTSLIPWHISSDVSTVSEREIRYSRGFSRCRPERWFPGFASHWLPLVVALGIEIKFEDIKPSLLFDEDFAKGYLFKLFDSDLFLTIDRDSEINFVGAVIAGASKQAVEVALEYFARRFVVSLAHTWSGGDSPNQSFVGVRKSVPSGINASIKINFLFGSLPLTLQVGLSQQLVDLFDNLWRRQLISSQKTQDLRVDKISIEVCRVALDKRRLAAGFKSGDLIELAEADFGTYNLFANEQFLAAAKARVCQDRLALETAAIPLNLPQATPEQSLIKVCLNELKIAENEASEITQLGALIDTGEKISGKVKLYNEQKLVGEGILALADGKQVVQIS